MSNKAIFPLRAVVYSVFSTIGDISAVTGINRQRMSKIVNGRAIPNVIEVCKIADSVGMSVDDIAKFYDYLLNDQKSTNK